VTEGPHLPLDALADLLVGEGAPGDVAHVSGCDDCSGRLVELDEAQAPVAAALAAYAALDVPAAPPDLAERLAAALATEPVTEPVTEPATEPAGVLAGEGPPAGRAVALGAPSGRDAHPLAPAVPLRRGAPRGRALLGVAAALAGLLAVAGAGVLGLSGRDHSGTSAAQKGPGSDTAAGGEAAVAAAAPALRATGTDYRRDPAALAAALPALLADDAAVRRDGALDGAAVPDRSVALGASALADDAGTGSRAATGDTSAASGAPPRAPAAGAAVAEPLARLRDPAQLDRCLSALPLSGPVRTPLAVDFAALEGHPAVLLVLPGDRPETVELVAVGPACGADGPDELYRAELPRPR
jgi:hypothetical protein